MREALLITLASGLTTGAMFGTAAEARSPTKVGACPNAADTAFSAHPQSLRRTAEAYVHRHYGKHTIIENIARATHRDYSNAVFTLCGSTVGRNSVLAVEHPTGAGPCASCNSALYFVKLRRGGWRAWVRFD